MCTVIIDTADVIPSQLESVPDDTDMCNTRYLQSNKANINFRGYMFIP